MSNTRELIYIVRCNIAHSEKTPRGPDRGKSKRDRQVSEATANLINYFFEILFEQPSERIAVYGTLAPGGANASELSDLSGNWYDGTVPGAIENRDGFLEFNWSTTDGIVPVKILSTCRLDENFVRLDRFEGPRYQRVLVPVTIDGKIVICNIYQGRP